RDEERDDRPREFERHAFVAARADALRIAPPVFCGEEYDQARDQEREEYGNRDEKKVQRVHSTGHGRGLLGEERGAGPHELTGASCWVRGAGCRAGCWVLGAEGWVLGAGCWVLGAPLAPQHHEDEAADEQNGRHTCD